MSVSISGSNPLTNSTATAALAGQKGAHRAGGGKGGGSDQDASSSTITNQVTTTNPDGSTTTLVTYADGTTATTNQPPPSGQSAALNKAQTAKAGAQSAGQPAQSGQPVLGGLLDTSNLGQNAALLAAQEKAKTPV
jgi:hypothetical protein